MFVAVTVAVSGVVVAFSVPSPLSVTSTVIVLGVVSYVTPSSPPSVSVIVKLYVPVFVNLILSKATVWASFVAVAFTFSGSTAPSGLFSLAASVNSKLSFSVQSRPVKTFVAFSSISPSAA